MLPPSPIADPYISDGSPGGQLPVGQITRSQVPGHQAPADQTLADHTLADQVSADQMLVDQISGPQAPARQAVDGLALAIAPLGRYQEAAGSLPGSPPSGSPHTGSQPSRSQQPVSQQPASQQGRLSPEGSALLPSPWPLWQAPFAEVQNATAGQQLSGPWKLLLLGDGSPTRHLQLLTGLPLEVELIAMAAETGGRGEAPAPAEIQELQQPLLRRQVWLNCGAISLGWAESWWNQQEAESHLRDRRQPIWRSLTSGRAELFREVDGLAQVYAPWLEERFGCAGPFWSRHYRFFRQGRELTVIREVFSPVLETWLGPALGRDTPTQFRDIS